MLERWNPTVKAATVLVCVLMLSFTYIITLNVAVFAMCMVLLLFCSKARLRTVLRVLAPALFAALGLFMMGLNYARDAQPAAEATAALSTAPLAVRLADNGSLRTALQLSTRLMAFAGVGMLFALTTNGESFIASLIHQAHLPPKFAYGVLAAVHLFPNIRRETAQVKLAFRARGVKVHWYSLPPLFTMLVNCIRWSACVSMAMESRGFSGNAPRTYRNVPHVRAMDIVLGVLWVSAIAMGMVFLKI